MRARSIFHAPSAAISLVRGCALVEMMDRIVKGLKDVQKSVRDGR
jgi:hypothetical protein